MEDILCLSTTKQISDRETFFQNFLRRVRIHASRKLWRLWRATSCEKEVNAKLSAVECLRQADQRLRLAKTLLPEHSPTKRLIDILFCFPTQAAESHPRLRSPVTR